MDLYNFKAFFEDVQTLATSNSSRVYLYLEPTLPGKQPKGNYIQFPLLNNTAIIAGLARQLAPECNIRTDTFGVYIASNPKSKL